jgi:anti-sigma regulatory factor (Ser/Thr protein kinase)
MEVAAHLRVPVRDRSDVAAIRTGVRRTASQAGIPEAVQERAALVATELGTNLVKHASSGGELLIREAGTDTSPYIELIALDRGPGMDLDRCLPDGFSSAGSPGTGLGAIQRLSTVFDAYSGPDGTVAFACVGAAPPARAAGFDVGGVSVLKEGETVCGDAWAVHDLGDRLSVIVADGLGHGPGASEAARSAIAVTPASNGHLSGAELLERIHAAIRHTRGAAAAVATLRPGAATVTFAGVGNVSGTVLTPAAHRQAVSNAGTLGHQARLFREYTYPWAPEALLVMYTDGLTTHWAIRDIPKLLRHHPAVIAAVLYRDFSRHRDDVTVVVLKEAA